MWEDGEKTSLRMEVSSKTLANQLRAFSIPVSTVLPLVQFHHGLQALLSKLEEVTFITESWVLHGFQILTRNQTLALNKKCHFNQEELCCNLTGQEHPEQLTAALLT